MASNVHKFPGGKSAESATLKDLMAGLTLGQRKIVATVTNQFQRELIAAFPEIQAGVATSGAQGSFSVTLDVKHAKKGRFKGTLKPRVRRPREATEFDMHIDTDGQLSLGLPDGWQDDGEDDAASTASGDEEDGRDDD